MATHETHPPADATIAQDSWRYTADERAIWDQLFARQSPMLTAT